MKKSIMLSVVGILSISMFANTQTSNKSVLKMAKYNIYCDGVYSGSAWASSQAIADAIAHRRCNG